MAETKRRKTANKKKVTRTVVLSSFATLFLATLGVLISVFAIPETREADLYEYYGVSEEETAVYLNGARSDVEVLRKNGTYYLPLETVQ